MAKDKTKTKTKSRVKLSNFPLERPPVPDGPNKHLKPPKFDPAMIRKLACLAHYYDLDYTNPVRGDKNPLFPSQRKFKELVEKYGDEEKATQRFEEFAQSYSGLAKAFLSALIEMDTPLSKFLDDAPPKKAKKK